jgi:hypothetical protein
MKNTTIVATLLSTVLVAPLAYLQLHNAKQNPWQFPYPLFAILWLVPVAFIFTAAPLIRGVQAGQSVLERPGWFLARVVFLVLAAMFWAGLVNDQMPCFLGVPNCD